MMHAAALVFVVEDDASLRASLQNLLRSVGLRVEVFASAQEFLRSTRPDVPSCLVLDVRLPGLSELELQQELAQGHTPMPIIFITGHGDIPMTVRAMKAGASDFLTKPFRDEDLLNAVAQALHHGHQRASNTHTPAAATPAAADDCRSDSRFAEIVGQSAALRHVLQQVDIVAPTDTTVLIDGETGTGKELTLLLDSGGVACKDGVYLSLSRLNHRLPRSQAHPEVVEGAAEFHHEITDASLPQAKPVFDNTAALDTT